MDEHNSADVVITAAATNDSDDLVLARISEAIAPEQLILFETKLSEQSEIDLMKLSVLFVPLDELSNDDEPYPGHHTAELLTQLAAIVAERMQSIRDYVDRTGYKLDKPPVLLQCSYAGDYFLITIEHGPFSYIIKTMQHGLLVLDTFMPVNEEILQFLDELVGNADALSKQGVSAEDTNKLIREMVRQHQGTAYAKGVRERDS